MEYTVVYSDMSGGFEGFIERVNEYIRNGWQPQGGVQYNNGYYYQAMIRK